MNIKNYIKHALLNIKDALKEATLESNDHIEFNLGEEIKFTFTDEGASVECIVVPRHKN